MDGEMAAFRSSGACGLTFGLNVNYMPARSGSGSQPAHPHASAFSETLLPHRGNLQEGPHTAALKKWSVPTNRPSLFASVVMVSVPVWLPRVAARFFRLVALAAAPVCRP